MDESTSYRGARERDAAFVQERQGRRLALEIKQLQARALRYGYPSAAEALRLAEEVIGRGAENKGSLPPPRLYTTGSDETH